MRMMRLASGVAIVSTACAVLVPNLAAAAAALPPLCSEVGLPDPGLYAQDDEFTVPPNVSTVVDVSANDGCIAGDGSRVLDSRVQVVTGAQHVTVGVTNDTVVDVRPEPGFCGDDSFTYRRGIGSAGNSATVELHVVATPEHACVVPRPAGVVVAVSAPLPYRNGGDAAAASVDMKNDATGGLAQLSAVLRLRGVDGRPATIGVLVVHTSGATYDGFVDIDDPGYADHRVRYALHGPFVVGTASGVAGIASGDIGGIWPYSIFWAVRPAEG